MRRGTAASAVYYDGVIFDMDGVLLEPAPRSLLESAAERAFEACGVPDPPADHVADVSLGVDVDSLERVCESHGLDRATFWQTRDACASRAQVRAALDGGKPPYDDVGALDAIERPLGVVSTNQQATVDYLLADYGLVRHFEVAYGRAPAVDHLRRKKPDPYFLERTAADLGVDETLFVGDSESDVLAARNAGVDAAYVRRPHRSDATLSVEPEYEVPDLRALLDVLGA